MIKSAAHKSTPPVVLREGASPDTASARSAFLLAATNMSWQLAIVVLVPIIGGFKLDEYFSTTPVLTIIGFVLAMVGMGLVVWRQLQLFSPSIPPTKETKK